MYKLVLSPRRYSAVLHASHVLDKGTELVILSNGMDEETPYRFCLEAMKIQRQFELEKAYKEFGVRQLYTMNQSMYHVDYELIAVKLQLLLVIKPYTHFYFLNNGDQRLLQICQAVNCSAKKLVYKPKGKVRWEHTLTDDEMDRKLAAIERMTTVRKELLAYQLEVEYVQK
jgi:hypothetical protein